MRTILCIIILLILPHTAQARPIDVLTDHDAIAVGGYDVVAYFTENRAVAGNSEHSVAYKNEATYYFSSQANKQAFQQSPERYLPEYGGFCAFAMASGDKAKTDPEAWTILDGKLYLNYNKSVRERWLKDPSGFIRSADHHWPTVKDEPYGGIFSFF